MNIIGIFGPKIVVLLAIWIPGYDLNCKQLLTAICGCKLIWDFDRGRPCESGLSYRLTSFLGYDFQEIVISMICLGISGAFTYAAMRESAWIPAALGMISTAFSLFEVLGAVKVALPERKAKPAAPKVHPPQSNSAQPVVPPVSPVSPIPANRVVPMGEKRPVVPQASAIVPISKLKESFKQESSRYYRSRFSILGDSISTLDGFVPAGYNVFYTGDACVKASVSRVEDTWWGKVIDFLGGELLVNNSWSGSRVSQMPGTNGLFPCGCSDERTRSLHENEKDPDVIIVYMGTNDWGYGVPTEPKRIGFFDEKTGMHVDGFETPNETIFSYAYDLMIKKLCANYPNAEIWCCTLCETYIPDKPSFQFPHKYSGIHIEEYNKSIYRLAQKNQCRVIDLYKYHIPYAAMDGTHPTEEGMSTIASLMIREVCGTEVETMVKDFPVRGLAENQEEYVDLKPGTTTELFTDTIELCRESTGQMLVARGNVLKAGRSNDCAIFIEHPNASRHHATFFFEGGGWYVRDEKSTNKTYLNDIVVEPGKKYRLYVGDILSFGPEKYCFFKSRLNPPKPKLEGKFEEAALAILEASIKTFVESGFNDDTAFKLILTSLSDAPLYVPVQIDVAAMLGNLDPSKLKAGDVITPQKDVRVKVLTLSLGDGGEIVPLFTSAEEVNKGQSVSTMRYYPSDYLPLLLKMEKHVVINPFSDHKFILTFDMIKNILKPVIESKTKIPRPVPPPIPVSKPVVTPITAEQKGVPTPQIKKQDSGSFIGKLIDGKYCILKEIGRGGVSVVYLGVDKRTNRQLSIKVIDLTAPHVRNNKTLYLQEPHMMMQFDHPAIPKVYEVVEDEQCLYIIREYIEGKTISNILEERGTIPADTAVSWTIQLCEALRYLHTHNPPYIFRDMKPSNIAVQPDGNLKIVDFGLAMVYDPTKQDDTVMGTHGYAAPEQYTGNSDFRTDIFALGMTLHQMLTGVDPCQPPYEVKPIRMINPDLPRKLEEIVKKCTQINPADRFQSCEELIAALQGGPDDPPKKKGLLEKLFGSKS